MTPHRRGMVGALVLLLAATVLALPAVAPSAPENAMSSGLPPATRMLRLGGVHAPLAAPGQAMVVNVWASWCGPCRAELPSLQALADRLDSPAVAVVGISIDRDRVFLREYLRGLGVTFAEFIDSEQVVVRGVLGVDSLPQTLLIAPDGTILRRVHGARDWASPDSLAEIASVLGGVIPLPPLGSDPRQ